MAPVRGTHISITVGFVSSSVKKNVRWTSSSVDCPVFQQVACCPSRNGSSTYSRQNAVWRYYGRTRTSVLRAESATVGSPFRPPLGSPQREPGLAATIVARCSEVVKKCGIGFQPLSLPTSASPSGLSRRDADWPANLVTTRALRLRRACPGGTNDWSCDPRSVVLITVCTSHGPAGTSPTVAESFVDSLLSWSVGFPPG